MSLTGSGIQSFLRWIVANRKSLFKAILGLSVGLLMLWNINLHNQNKKLSESLEMAQNNIEAYQGSLAGSQQANNVLKMDIESLRYQNDKTLQQLDSVRRELKIKANQVHTAATQTQVLYVSDGKGVEGDLIEILKDTTYTDSIKYNDLTTIYYTIGADTVSMTLDLQNTQYLYIYDHKEYKNKKNFIKRLFTWDFKKVHKYKYTIHNTNDLLKSEDVRIVESNKQ